MFPFGDYQVLLKISNLSIGGILINKYVLEIFQKLCVVLISYSLEKDYREISKLKGYPEISKLTDYRVRNTSTFCIVFKSEKY